DKFKDEMLESETAPNSWFAEVLSRAWIIDQLVQQIGSPFSEWVDGKFRRSLSRHIEPPEPVASGRRSFFAIGAAVVFALLVVYGAYHAAELLITLPRSAWS